MLKTVSSIVNAIGALNYKGTWNASSNVPPLSSGVGTKGDYYVVSTAGSTNLDGTTLWGVGDWAVFNGSIWQKVDGGDTSSVTSLIVTGLTGYMYANGANVVTGSTTIPNAGLANSSVTINGTSVSLGGSGTVTANTTAALTLGTGLTGTSFNGSTAVTANLANTAVSAGSYGNASTVGNFTVDAQGRLTSAANTTIAIAVAAVSGAVPNTVNVIAGTNMSGGGALTGNVTLNTVQNPTFTTSITSPAISGGTTASSSLTFKSTTGVGTTDFIRFYTGNNGANLAVNMTNSGNVQIGSFSAQGKLGVHGDAVNFSPSADNSSNGIGATILGQNVATATSALARLYMTGWNSAHAGTLDLRSGSVVGSTINMYNVAGTKTVYFNTDGDSYITSGNVGIGTSSPNASAILDAQSTTKGVCFPNMTTTQKNAVSAPAAGLVVFDTTLAKLCVYSGSAWQTITSI
jgi:hypothetical protein